MTLEQLQKKMRRWQKKAPEELKAALLKAGAEVVAHSRANYLTGPRPEKLGVVTETLRRSITQRVRKETSRTILQVGTKVWYGRRHEYGEGTRPRPFLRPAIKDKLPRVMEVIVDAMMEAYKKSG